MVLMELRTSGGKVRRCDARCYNAKGPKCRCICGGRNHGVGLQKAIENTREEALKALEAMGAEDLPLFKELLDQPG